MSKKDRLAKMEGQLTELRRRVQAIETQLDPEFNGRTLRQRVEAEGRFVPSAPDLMATFESHFDRHMQKLLKLLKERGPQS